VTLPILERLSKFQYKITKLQAENDDLKIKSQTEEVDRILRTKDESDSEDSEAAMNIKNSKFMKATDRILVANSTDGEASEAKGYFDTFREQRNAYLMTGKKLEIKIINQLSKMDVKGKLSNIELWIPLDSMNQFSRVLSLGLSTHLGYRAGTSVRHQINEITNEMIESKLMKSQEDANVVITQLCISMLNRHLLEVQDDLTSEKILLPSRIDLSYDKFINTPQETDITNIDITIEPIDMKVGFRELDNFKKLGEVLGQFAARISTPPEEEQSLGDTDQGDGIDHLKETEIIGDDERQLAKTVTQEVVLSTKPKIRIKDRKMKEFIKMNIKLISESINFALMDDTGVHEYPLINFSISKILAKVAQETGEDDAQNFILKKMGISQYPYMKLDAALLLEANYFNMDVGSYEPLIEPWTFNAMVLQKTAFSSQEIKLSSEEMLNINLTYGMALALKRIQTKLTLDTEGWEDEEEVEDNKRKIALMKTQGSSTKKTFTTLQRKTTKGGEDDEDVSGFVFENYLGIQMRITLENHDSWKDQGVKLDEKDSDAAVVVFDEWEDAGERYFRNLRELHNINKAVKKQQNGGKLVENFERNIIRFDVYIDGFEPITGVPIEISGRRSYELAFVGETEKQRKKTKHHYSITVDVKTEGKKKIVSFESQLSI
jgi:hypothetical protein